MVRSQPPTPVFLRHSDRSKIVTEYTEMERSNKLGAPGEAAGDIGAIVADRVDDEGLTKRAKID